MSVTYAWRAMKAASTSRTIDAVPSAQSELRSLAAEPDASDKLP